MQTAIIVIIYLLIIVTFIIFSVISIKIIKYFYWLIINCLTFDLHVFML